MLVEKPTGTIRTAYDSNNDPYLFEATGAEAKRFIDILNADDEGRLLVLPCCDDVKLECKGLLYKGDHWNQPTLTAFAADPSTRSGLRVHCFGIEEAEAALRKEPDNG